MFSSPASPTRGRAVSGELVMALGVGALTGPVCLVFAGVIATTEPHGGAIAMGVATLAFGVTPVGQIVAAVAALSWLRQTGAYPHSALARTVRPRLAHCWAAWVGGWLASHAALATVRPPGMLGDNPAGYLVATSASAASFSLAVGWLIAIVLQVERAQLS